MKNKYEIRGDVTAIYLDRKDGTTTETLIETKDLNKVSDFGKWSASRSGLEFIYVQCYTRFENGKRESFQLHRVIMNAPKGLQVDHINGDTLDNRGSNLRVVTSAQNCQNRKAANTGSKSGIRGVHWFAPTSNWRVIINVFGKRYYLGAFQDKDEAGVVASRGRALLMSHSGDAETVTPLKIKEIIRSENQAFKSNKSSGIRGVYWREKQSRWIAAIQLNGKKLHFGSFEDIEEAEAVVVAARKKIKNNELVTPKKQNKLQKSGVKGIRWHTRTKKWQAFYAVNGKEVYVGLYASVEEATAAVAEARKSLA